MPALSAALFREEEQFFSRQTLRFFYRALGLTLLALVLFEWRSGRAALQTGELCGRRASLLIPLYGSGWLALEWSVLACCGAALALGWRRRLAARLACAAGLASLTQFYMNQKALIVLTLLYLALAPPDPEQDGVAHRAWPNIALIRYQLLIVYAFSGLMKLRAGFVDGKSLQALFENLARMPEQGWLPAKPALALFSALPGSAAAASWLVVLAELGLPLLLLRRPRLGLAAVALLHGGFMLFMPGIAPFTLVMLTDASLFLPGRSGPHPAS